MKKKGGFSSFEFYFVIAVIGLILIAGIQRYYKLAEETQRLSFEILAQNFSASVYSYRARWIMAQQSPEKLNQLIIENAVMQFSPQGWPMAIVANQSRTEKLTLSHCVSLWNVFLQNPPAISFASDDHSRSSPYHVTLTADDKCHFELVSPKPKGYYFEYSPFSGQVNTYTSPIVKNN